MSMTQPSNGGRERRRFQRFPVCSNVEVYFQLESHHEPLKAKLSDISIPFMGLKLMSNHTVPTQSTIKLKLISDQGELIAQCDGSVAWCRELVTEPASDEVVHQIGVFIQVKSTEIQQVLDAQISRLVPMAMPTLLYTRLKNQSADVQRRFDQHGLEYTDEIATVVNPILDLNYRFALLLEMISKINSTLNSAELLTRIMEAAKEIMNSEASSLMLLDKTTRELVIQIPTGPIKEQITGIRIPYGQGIAGWVAEHEEAVVTEDAATDPRHYGQVDSASGFKTRSLICVPMKGPSGEILGVLEALNRHDNAPYTQTDIDLFIVLADQAAIALEKARLHAEALEKQRLEQQLTLAHHIQERFLPSQPPTVQGARLAGMSQSALHVGGDYYDFLLHKDGTVSLVVGDVSGKGAPAALLMASLQAALRAHVQYHGSVAETVSRINNGIWEETPDDKFLTLFYAIFNPMTKTLTYTNAGHNPPLLYRSGDRVLQFLDIGGTLVGIFPDFPFEEGHETFQPGDILVIYTDGVTESMNQQEELFGTERLYALIQQNSHLDAEALVQLIYQSVSDFAQSAEQFDDITLLVLKVESDEQHCQGNESPSHRP